MAFYSYLFRPWTLARERRARSKKRDIRSDALGAIVALAMIQIGCDDSETTTTVAKLSGVVSLASGDDHTCALRSDHTVACWGSNRYGQLGVETKKTAFQVLDPIGLTVTATADYHGYAQPINELTGVVQIAAGRYHTCALLDSGAVRCWGDSAYGQLGNGDFSLDDCNGRPCCRRPVDVEGISDATAIAAGPSISCAIHNGGTLSCWGGNEIGVNPRTLDRCSKKACVTRPVAIATDPKVAQVALGPNHGCLIRENGKVACWGSNLYGQVGVVKDTETSAVLSDVLEPTDVPLPGGATALLLSRFSDTSCAVLEDQSLYCWGHNDVGQLGIGNYPQTCALDADTSTPCATAPQKNAPQTNVQFSRYLKGINHNCALSVDVLYCWGADKDGQLGVDADRLEHCAPNLLCAKSPINIYSEIAVLDGVLGPNYTCVVVSDQQIQCAGWGFATAEAIAVNARVINCSKWCKVDLGWEATVEAIAITHLDRMCVLGNHGQVRCLTAYNPSAETLDTESIMVRQ